MKKYFFVSALCILTLSSCATIPEGVTAVEPFDQSRYLGDWYEIARMDFRFERGLNNTKANYSINNDGSIKVTNRGFNYEKKEWKEAVGKAKFVNGSNKAMLKVSFFGPFYSGYNVIALDNDYKYALIAGKNLKYLWILSRYKTIPDEIRQEFLMEAESAGYKVSNLIWVSHDK
ncbi:MAG: lipocalin family protein [Rikenellaceae bacterium]|nr:lipocalin family protein [Rikenellaceae bacterium]